MGKTTNRPIQNADAVHSLSVELLEPFAKELQEISDSSPSAKLLPERFVTRPKTTNEHLITEAELAHIENSGDSGLHSMALMFIGGAISSLPPFITSGIKWYSATTPTELVDLVQLLTFPICSVIGFAFFKYSPVANGTLKKICADIKSREAVRPGDV